MAPTQVRKARTSTLVSAAIFMGLGRLQANQPSRQRLPHSAHPGWPDGWCELHQAQGNSALLSNCCALRSALHFSELFAEH
jgi:hypothetical protein